jgi:hypothetical protein
MINHYRRLGIGRLGLTLVVTAAGCLSVPSAEAAGPNRSSDGWTPQGPIFRTLDALAGGIETVLQRTVLSRRNSSGCDALGCDDACDQLTLQQLEPRQHQGVPPQYAPQPPGHSVMPTEPPHPFSDMQSLPYGQAPPRALPRVPTDQRFHQPAYANEERWHEGFAPPPSNRNGQPQQTVPPQQYDSLPNPFLDDPQGYR